MLIGSGTLKINDATMKAIIQEWLDKRYSEGLDPGPKVTTFWIASPHDGSYNIGIEGRPHVNQA